MTDRLAARVEARLRSLRDAGLLRTLRAPAGLDLSSNDYLDLANDPRVVAAFQRGAAQEGAGSTGSRLLRGHRDAFTDVERAFAAFKGAEAALYFSSGYLANLGVLTSLTEAGDVIVSDERNHASLIDAMRLSAATRVIVPHNDLAALEAALSTARSAAAAEARIFVVVESVFSMDGDAAPLASQAALCAAFDATLIVDEAHAVGLFGRRGSGMIEAAGVDPNTISINSAGKALGVGGAFVAGPAWAIEYLVQRARTFVFSTAPPPAVTAAIAESLRIVATEPDRRARVIALARLARERLAAAGIDVPSGDSPIVPILIGDSHRAAAVAERLQARGFDIRAIRPPTVSEGSARLRLSVNARLEDAAIVEFVAALAALLEEVAPWPAVTS
ncbi:MAG TPA: 8-amino-7-oxononanoate synthase [Vicinamibacterales bacterium]|nr:8-amino-7-oxononanoate synthase [Vicinamibacterales bacterium]